MKQLFFTIYLWCCFTPENFSQASIVRTCKGNDLSIASNVKGTHYQWQVSADNGSSFKNLTNDLSYPNVANDTLKIKDVPDSLNAYQYRCLVQDINYSKVFILKVLNEWVGKYDKNWHNSKNWSCGTIPGESTHVLITKGSVTVNSHSSCKEVEKKGDGKILIYNKFTLTIGGEIIQTANQIWMARNLSVDKYRNGDLIPQVQNAADWYRQKSGAWCYYENNTENGIVYGKLYNLYAILDPRGLAPQGWHIPSDIEWTTLINYFGSNAGGIMKEFYGWNTPNVGVNKPSGFHALPGGSRHSEGFFEDKGSAGAWWSTTGKKGVGAWFRVLVSTSNAVLRPYIYSDVTGMSVRCVKD